VAAGTLEEVVVILVEAAAILVVEAAGREAGWACREAGWDVEAWAAGEDKLIAVEAT
jgi:hypothetical protein